MRTTRREVLATLAAGLAVGTSPGCTGEKLEPGPWVPGGDEDFELFPYGVQAGDPTVDGIVLSVRTTETDVRFEVVRVTDEGWAPAADISATTDNGVAQVVVEGLRAGSRHQWVVWAADGSRRSLIGAFRTAPEQASGVVRFGAVSCLGGNRPFPVLTRAAEAGLDFFLLLGDTIYVDWSPLNSIRAIWEEALEQDGMLALTSSTGLIATWDDHEVWNNWDPEDPDDAADAERALTQFRMAIPQRTGPTGGIWRSMRWGDDVELFVLDCRSERLDGRYMSREQLDWLIDGLEASTARFKIVMNSVPITDLSSIPIYGDIGAEDRWQGFPGQRSRLVETVADIPGVLFVSGDFHVGGAMYIDEAGQPGEAVPEVLAGPGGSPIHELYSLVPTGGRILAVITQHNYTRFECYPDEGRIRVIWVDDDGADLRTLDLTV